MAYDTWVARVIRTVPEDRLLVFAPTDGWKPLCDFLSPLRESIHKKCQTILENKQPYPFENETKKLEAVFFLPLTFFPRSASAHPSGLFCYWGLHITAPDAKLQESKRHRKEDYLLVASH